MENRMRTSDNRVLTPSIEHLYLHAGFAAFYRSKKRFFFSYINYNFYFEKCQVKFLFFLKFFLKKNEGQYERTFMARNRSASPGSA